MAKIFLEPTADDVWPAAVREAVAWAERERIELRDAIFLVPFSQHLGLARRAWAGHSRWMPRVETTLTLARGLAPPESPVEGEMRFDVALDSVAAAGLLSSQTRFATLKRHHPGAFDEMVSSLVTVAHAMARAMACQHPARRAAWLAAVRQKVGDAMGVAGAENQVARIALEWAALSTPPASDALFSLKPSAWIVVEAGGEDPLLAALTDPAHCQPPVLRIDTDPSGVDPVETMAACARVQIQVCEGFEDEAQRTAARVLSDLEVHGATVALIAQDRMLVRRVHALLSRQDIRVRDETGWTLSTTRAAASVLLLLRAARPAATIDEWLDAVKAWPPGRVGLAAVASLEDSVRRHQWSRPAAVDPSRLSDEAAAVWAQVLEALAPLRESRELRLGDWCRRWMTALDCSGLIPGLTSDAAGRQVLAALHMGNGDSLGKHPQWLSLAEFTRWADLALESANFIPESPDEPEVVITPAARAMLRPFSAIVWPGADEKRLGAAPARLALLSNDQIQAFGMATPEQLLREQELGFAQALRGIPLTLLLRTDDDGEPVSASPLVQRLIAARAQAGLPLPQQPQEVRPERLVNVTPVPRPQPSAAGLLPQRLSASACEALRTCPYQFFAIRMLGLRSVEELDGDLEKRDYGNWLHAVLLRFHQNRPQGSSAAQDETALATMARDTQIAMGLDDADFLPYLASFERFLPRYLSWLQTRDVQGAQWLDGEREVTVHPPEWQGIAMHGVIDRIDRVKAEGGSCIQLIDYKTGSSTALQAKVKWPYEDTQLPFYAALVQHQEPSEFNGSALNAMYLALDDSQRIVEVPHPLVEHSAETLLSGLAHDLARLRAGAPLPALGEGSACDYCDARGLCRRDHWGAVAAEQAQA